MITLGILALILVLFGYAACATAGREDDIEDKRWREWNESKSGRDQEVC